MRVAMFSNAYLPTISGVVTSIDLFRRGLKAAGHEVFVFAPDYEDYQDPEPFIFRFPALDLSERLDVSVALPIKPIMEPAVFGVKPDLIHSHHPVWMGDLAHVFADDLGIPLVFTFHTQYERYAETYMSLAPRLASLITEEVVGRYLQHCRHIVVPTESIRAMLASEFGIDQGVTVVPTPVDIEQFQGGHPEGVRCRYVNQGEHLLLYVGRIAKEKGLDLLLQAFAIVHAELPSAHLLLVGRGPYREALEGKVSGMGLSERVSFAGAIPHEAVHDYYAAADLFVFSSRTETQGLVLIEAMASGTPVVAVDAPGSTDVLQEGGGVLTTANAQAFAAGILEVLQGEGRLADLAREARAAVERFSIPAATAQLAHAYQKALASSSRHR